MTTDPLQDMLAGVTAPPAIPKLELINGFEAIMQFTQWNGWDHHSDEIHEFTGTVLGERKTKTSTKGDNWAVWGCAYIESLERWDTFSGDYFSDLNQARFCFGRRLIHNTWGATVRGARMTD